MKMAIAIYISYKTPKTWLLGDLKLSKIKANVMFNSNGSSLGILSPGKHRHYKVKSEWDQA